MPIEVACCVEAVKVLISNENTKPDPFNPPLNNVELLHEVKLLPVVNIASNFPSI